ncbi:MAG: hypothetical protein H0W72_09970 [Planctomycetes bacterium]|nr:hypothetical protein [Planctomycetota bacterium]
MPANAIPLLILFAMMPLLGAAQTDTVDLSDIEADLAAAVGKPLGTGDVRSRPLLVAEFAVDGESLKVAEFATAAHAELSGQGDDQLYTKGRWGFDLQGLSPAMRERIVAKLGLKPPTKPKRAPLHIKAATAAILKSGVLPAMVQFQAGGYTDQDGNGLGEYGLFPQMSGAHPVGGITLNLLAPAFAVAEPVIDGYRFRAYLPAGPDSALTSAADGDRPLLAAGPGVSLQEQCWIVYAWPDESEGDIFVINQTGNVFVRPWDGTAPEWHALYGKKDWAAAAAPGWKPYRR